MQGQPYYVRAWLSSASVPFQARKTPELIPGRAHDRRLMRIKTLLHILIYNEIDFIVNDKRATCVMEG